MDTALVIQTLTALQQGQYRANREMLIATGATEEQLAEYDRMQKGMAAMQEHTNDLLELITLLGAKESAPNIPNTLKESLIKKQQEH